MRSGLFIRHQDTERQIFINLFKTSSHKKERKISPNSIPFMEEHTYMVYVREGPPGAEMCDNANDIPRTH